MKFFRGQILVITLLALTVIAVAILGLVSIANESSRQVRTSAEYQDLLNYAENSILQRAGIYADVSNNLSGLLVDPETSNDCFTLDNSVYTCEFNEENTSTTLETFDTNIVKDYGLSKDEKLDLDIDGYIGNFNFSVDSEESSILLFTVTYFNPFTSDYGIVSTMFDPDDSFDSNGGGVFSTSHDINFSTIGAGNYRLDLSSISGVPAGSSLRYLTIKNLMINPGEALLNISPTNAGLKNQIREISATSNKVESNANIIAATRTKIPIANQTPSALDYVLVTDGEINKYRN